MKHNSDFSKETPSHLTESNYYRQEANWKYMSVSQYKDFMKCETAALAKLKGEWTAEISGKALLVGNYVHSYFESPETHERFKQENEADLFSKRKPYGLLKDFKVAEQMIDRIKDEPFFKFLWQGEPETIVTGELFGVTWKGKIDLLNVDKGYFVDLKTTATFNKRFWNRRYSGYVSFVEEYGYIIQMGVYEQLLELQYGKPFKGYIYAVTKENEPDIAAIEPERRKIEFELDHVAETIERVEAVKTGQAEPEHCGICDYCKRHKKLNNFVTPEELLEAYR